MGTKRIVGTEWEHIIEAVAGGKHWSGNLALTTAQMEKQSGSVMAFRRAVRDIARGSPGDLPAPDGRSLRQHLTRFVALCYKQMEAALLRH